MVVDTSALMAIVLGEEGYERYLEAIINAPSAVMSAVNLYEASVATFMKRRSKADVDSLISLVGYLDIQIVGFDAAMSAASRETYFRYGKGVHPAGLNFGDCPAYVLAAKRNEPLLFKGDDFTQTDVVSAI